MVGWFGLGLGNPIEKRGSARSPYGFSPFDRHRGVWIRRSQYDYGFTLLLLISRIILVGIRAKDPFNPWLLLVPEGWSLFRSLSISVGFQVDSFYRGNLPSFHPRREQPTGISVAHRACTKHWCQCKRQTYQENTRNQTDEKSVRIVWKRKVYVSSKIRKTIVTKQSSKKKSWFWLELIRRYHKELLAPETFEKIIQLKELSTSENYQGVQMT